MSESNIVSPIFLELSVGKILKIEYSDPFLSKYTSKHPSYFAGVSVLTVNNIFE